MKTKTDSYFRISIKGHNGYFANDGWSGYARRWALMNNGKLPEGEQVYGYEQALAHIAELREHFYEGKLIYKDSQFEITIVTTVETTIPV